MATGDYFRTNVAPSTGETRSGSTLVTITTPGDANLTSGDTFTVSGSSQTFTYQGLVSVDAQGGGTTTGFYATAPGGSVRLFTIDDPAARVTPTLTGGDFVVCFLSGTLIATSEGEKAVEKLAIGDLVLTPAGQSVPVLWVGRQTVSTLFGLDDAHLPVCISAGALGENLPVRDLRVTAGHALLIDGVLVHASALVNGSSITRMARAELGHTFTVYHIETESHEIVLAEAAPSETFVDNVTRSRFDNYAEYVALFGAEGRQMAERSEPRALSPRQVPPAVRAVIAARAALLAGQTAVAA